MKNVYKVYHFKSDNTVGIYTQTANDIETVEEYFKDSIAYKDLCEKNGGQHAMVNYTKDRIIMEFLFQQSEYYPYNRDIIIIQKLEE
jgi:hypothetical protein